MFEAETRSVILERLKKYYAEFKGTDVSAVEGTFSFDTLAANAKEFEKAYAEMDLMMDAAFPQTSWGIYLDRLADELAGLSRRAATPAVVTLSIAGTAGVTVPAGSLFATASGTNFATDEAVKLDDKGTGTVKATAQSTGAGGNVAAGSITVIPVSIYGVSKVMNEAAAYNGYEEETDGALLERILFAVRQPHLAMYTITLSGPHRSAVLVLLKCCRSGMATGPSKLSLSMPIKTRLVKSCCKKCGIPSRRTLQSGRL